MKFFHRKQKTKAPEAKTCMSGLKYKGKEIEIIFDLEAGKKHIHADYEALTREGIEKLIREEYIPWLKGDRFQDKDDEKIMEGLEVDQISYHYHKIIAQYSPTKEEGFFGEFEFQIISCSDYTADMLEADIMLVYVSDGAAAGVDMFIA